jgi:hypothetical protein
LVASLTVLLAACTEDKTVDPPPSQATLSGLDLALAKCPDAPVLTTMSEPVPSVVISDNTTTNRHMVCIMKALEASDAFLQRVENDRRATQRAATSDGEWTSERLTRSDAGYNYEYWFSSGTDRLTVLDNTQG